MSSGARIVGGTLDILESNPELAPVGTTRIRRRGGVLQASTDGLPFVPLGGGSAIGWEAERLAVAVDRVSSNGVTLLNRFTSTDLIQRQEFFLSAANTPTIITTESGGVYRTPAAGAGAAGWLSLGNVDDVKIIGAPKTQSWAAAVRIKIPAAAVTAGRFIVPLGIVQAGGTAIYIECIQSQSATVFQLDLVNGGANFTPLGANATIGAPTCPVGAFFPVGVYFNAVAGTLRVEFSDTLAASFSGAQLDLMGTGAASLIFGYASDEALAMQVDGAFAAWTAAA